MKAAAREIPTQIPALEKNSQRTLVVEECFQRKFVINDPSSSPSNLALVMLWRDFAVLAIYCRIVAGGRTGF